MSGLTRWEPTTRWNPFKELEEMEKNWREENERIMRAYPPDGDYPDPPALPDKGPDPDDELITPNSPPPKNTPTRSPRRRRP